MSNPVTITIGLVTSAVRSGLNSLKSQFHALREHANGELGGALIGGGLIATIDKIIEKAGHIEDLSERFGVLPEALQEITNAAMPNGAAMEDVAAAMNKTVLSQEKVRKGNEDARNALKALNIEAKDFINASPEEAFYMIADGVAKADDRTAAYGATIELMGKKSGVLFTTIEQGSAAIKEQGQAVGTMSNDTVKRLDDLGDMFTNLKNDAMAYGGEVLAFIVKVVQSVSALVSASVGRVMGMFDNLTYAMHFLIEGNFEQAGVYAKKFAKDMVFAGDETQNAFETIKGAMGDIWQGKTDKPKKGPARDLEETEKELADRKKLDETYDKIDAKKAALGVKELADTEKINALIEQRDKMYEDAANQQDLQKQADIWEKALDIEKDIMDLRQKADKEAEERADRIAKKKESMEEKAFKESLENMTEAEKRAALLKRNAVLEAKIIQEPDEEKQLEIASQIQDIEAALNKKPKMEVVTSTLGHVGGGGNAYIGHAQTDAQRTARAAENLNKNVEKGNGLLKEIRDKVNKPAVWPP